MNGRSSGLLAAKWCIDGEKKERTTMRTGMILLLLGLSMLGGCSKCGDFLGAPSACRSEAPSTR